MFPSRSRLATFALALVLGGCGESAPPPPVVELHPTTDTIATGFAETVGAAWLGGARWAVVAPLDVTVSVLDFGSHRSAPLGKTGEIKNPAQVFVAGDTLYVGDWGLRRTSLWTLQGRLVRAVPAAAVARGALPEARDDAGRFYLELAAPAGSDGSGNRDSAAVAVADATITRVDTVARLAPLDMAEVMGESGRRFERRVFSGSDHWGALADGTLWVARVYHNRVDVRSPEGRWTEGQSLPDRVLEVTRYDRELFYRKFPPELRATAERLPFAPIKPPFEAAFADPAGEVWLEKSRAPADSSRRYHVVDRRGRLLREIRVPGPGRILAVGDRSALVAERVSDGTRFVLFQLPAATAAR
jgi:hypothetical protein